MSAHSSNAILCSQPRVVWSVSGKKTSNKGCRVAAMWLRIHRRTRCYQHMIRGYQLAVGAREARCLNRSDALTQSLLHPGYIDSPGKHSAAERLYLAEHQNTNGNALQPSLSSSSRTLLEMNPKQRAGKPQVTSGKRVASTHDRGSRRTRQTGQSRAT